MLQNSSWELYLPAEKKNLYWNSLQLLASNWIRRTRVFLSPVATCQILPSTANRKRIKKCTLANHFICLDLFFCTHSPMTSVKKRDFLLFLSHQKRKTCAFLLVLFLSSQLLFWYYKTVTKYQKEIISYQKEEVN